MGAQAEALKARARQFALDVMRLVDRLPLDESSRYLGRQLLRAANGVGGNYRAACRGRSRAEFAAKIGLVAEEADESAHWLDLLEARQCEPRQSVQKLLAESRELEAIFSASYGTARRNLRAPEREKGRRPEP
jgi:four helix bundle protein